MTHTEDSPPLKLAAPAPEEEDDDSTADAQVLAGRPDLHALCEDWAYWCRTRRFYVKPSLPVSLLGKLTSKGTGRSSSGGPDAPTSAELAAFHIAFTAQPEDALDRRVFELHYYHRVRNVKMAAAELGVSRQHWYRLVADCRARVYAASRQILEQREGERAQMLTRLDLAQGVG
jgi:hypothetical protein